MVLFIYNVYIYIYIYIYIILNYIHVITDPEANQNGPDLSRINRITRLQALLSMFDTNASLDKHFYYKHRHWQQRTASANGVDLSKNIVGNQNIGVRSKGDNN